jgi:AraC-like DNA-binding protein
MFLVYVGLAWAYVLRRGILRTFRSNRIGCTWILTLLVLATIGYGMVCYSMVWDLNHPEAGHARFLGSVRVSILIYACIMLFVFREPRVMYGYAFVAAVLDPPHRPRPTTSEIWQSFDGRPAEVGNARMPAPASAGPEAVSDRKAPEPPLVIRQQLDDWRRALLDHMEHEKPFLNPGFRLHHLAEALDIAPHHCSYLIRIEFGRNFNHWVNEYRVRNFIQLHACEGDILTLEAMARRSGFSNRRTLHNAFLKVHGQPPGSYFQKRDGNPPVGQP